MSGAACAESQFHAVGDGSSRRHQRSNDQQAGMGGYTATAVGAAKIMMPLFADFSR